GKLMAKINPTNKAVARGMSRVWYWMWGLLELLERFPGQVPDVDITMQVEDTPKVERVVVLKPPKGGPKQHIPYTLGDMKNPPPIIFSAARNPGTIDLLWPLWTMWGEDIPGTGPKTGGFHDPAWEGLLPKIIEAGRSTPWTERKHKNAFWRGAARTSGLRDTLIACSGKPEFRVDASSVQHKTKEGKPIGALDRVGHQYLVYMDGRTFSSAMLPMIPTGALLLFPESPFETLHSRAFRNAGHYLPIDKHAEHLCHNSVEWAEAHPAEAAAKSKAALDWADQNLRMEKVYEYMLHMLQAYAKLQKFKPKPLGKVIGWGDVMKNVKRKRPGTKG
ncbi:hypothetical protein CYMTET_7512, partial [Cymbomonas tetramitiformis]